MNDEPLVLTIPECAELLRISENHARNLVDQGIIPAVRFGKLIRIPRWALIQLLATASGSPLPADYNVAIDAEESVHGQRPEEG